MIVYMDAVFLLNALVDYLLLVVCGQVTEAARRKGRAVAAGLLGGVYATVSLLPDWRFLSGWLWRGVMSLLLCWIAFGGNRNLIKRCIVLWGLASMFSGIVFLLTELFSAPASMIGGAIYYPLTFAALVLTAGGSFAVFLWGIRSFHHRGGDLAEVSVRLQGRSQQFLALRDTGNTLRDPISGTPVLVADAAILLMLLPELKLEKNALEHPEKLLKQVYEAEPTLRPRLIPYKTVGVSRAMLLAVAPEEIWVDGTRETLLMAFSPVPVSDGGAYQALLGGKL